MQNESTAFSKSLRAVERVAGDLDFGSRAYGRGPANEVAVTAFFLLPLSRFIRKKFQNQIPKNSGTILEQQCIPQLF